MNLHYDVHGAALSVQADDVHSSSIVRQLLGYFPAQAAASPDSVKITVRTAPDGLPEAPPSAIPLCQNGAGAGGWAVYEDDAGHTVRFHEAGAVRIPRNGGASVVQLVDSGNEEDALYCLHFALVEMMKRRGKFTLHAATLERRGHGILISGASGRGKTTSCLSLIRSGYRCVADDHPFLEAKDGLIHARSFPEPIQVTDDTRRMIPELQAANAPLTPGERKWLFRLEDVYGAAWAETCVPRVVLFPQVIQWSTSYVEPMSPARVMEELLPNGFRVLDRSVATAHFHLLADLARQTRGYRLFLGEDVLELPKVIDPLTPD
ncbi:MAG TPA: hypothetical protein VGM37_00390 [Armatimonadota bacterium]|jgi:hypothetical protein